MRNDSVPRNGTNDSTILNPSSTRNTQTMQGDSSSGQSNATLNNSSLNANSNTGNSMSNTMTSNNQLANPLNIQGQRGYAALPVLETYIPGMVLSKIKEKYGNTVYDISAERISNSQDSAMAMQNSNTQNEPAAANPASATPANADSSQTIRPVTQNSSVPVQYNYLVRLLKNGTLVTETINSDGDVVNNANAANKQ